MHCFYHAMKELLGGTKWNEKKVLEEIAYGNGFPVSRLKSVDKICPDVVIFRNFRLVFADGRLYIKTKRACHRLKKKAKSIACFGITFFNSEKEDRCCHAVCVPENQYIEKVVAEMTKLCEFPESAEIKDLDLHGIVCRKVDLETVKENEYEQDSSYQDGERGNRHGVG